VQPCQIMPFFVLDRVALCVRKMQNGKELAFCQQEIAVVVQLGSEPSTEISGSKIIGGIHNFSFTPKQYGRYTFRALLDGFIPIGSEQHCTTDDIEIINQEADDTSLLDTSPLLNDTVTQLKKSGILALIWK
jgi:hypothetical protein